MSAFSDPHETILSAKIRIWVFPVSSVRWPCSRCHLARKFLINPLKLFFYSHFFHVRDYFQICLVIVRGVQSNFFSNDEKFEFETVSEIYHRKIFRLISSIRRIRPITHVLQKGKQKEKEKKNN